MGVTKPYPDDDSNASNHKLVSFQGGCSKAWKSLQFQTWNKTIQTI